jgi:hypothetical protein
VKNKKATIVLLGYPFLEQDPTYVYQGVHIGARVRRLTADSDRIYQELINELGSRYVYTPMSPALEGREPVGRAFTSDTWFVRPTKAVPVDTYYHPSSAGWTAEANELFADSKVPEYVEP